MPYEITHHSHYPIPLPLRAFTVLLSEWYLPSGHAWALHAVRARGRNDGPPKSHGMRIHLGCASVPRCAPSLPLLERLVALRALSLGSIMLGLIVVAYRSKHADKLMSEISSVMILTWLCLDSTKECAGVGRVAQRVCCSRAYRSCPSPDGRGAREGSRSSTVRLLHTLLRGAYGR